MALGVKKMVKNVFWLFMVSFGLTVFYPNASAHNEAARWLAEKMHAEARHQIRTKQWYKVLAALELASWLDPTTTKAKEAKGEWEAKLKNWAEQKYQIGLKAYQSQKFAEAKIHWQEARQILREREDPLRAKIDLGLKLLNGEEVLLPTTKPKASEKKQPEMTQKMAAVSEFLATGESEKARLTLAEILHQDPQNERAKKLLENLSRQEVKPTHSMTGERYKEAEKVFEEGKEVEAQKQEESAYPYYAKAFALLNTEPFKPYFFTELAKRKENLENRIRETMKPKLEIWRRNQNQMDLKKLATELRKVTRDYPFLSEAEDLLAKTYIRLDEKTRPILIEAKTVQELEGCRASVGKFEKVKKIAVFSEVLAWAEADRNLEVCKSTENGNKSRELRTETEN